MEWGGHIFRPFCTPMKTIVLHDICYMKQTYSQSICTCIDKNTACMVIIFCICYPSHNDKTPLLCAAEAGQDEIVAYLLQFRKVRTDLRKQPGEVESASVSQATTCIL